MLKGESKSTKENNESKIFFMKNGKLSFYNVSENNILHHKND